jgi:thioredoxin-related protein
MTPPPHARITLLALVCTLIAASVTPAQAPSAQVQWRTDYNSARREARERGRPLFLDIGSENCVWCVKLDTTTFRDPAVIALLNEQMVPLKVDGTRERTLVEALRIQAYPTLVLADPDGKVFETVEGYVEAAKLHGSLQRLLASVQVPAWMTRAYQEAATALETGDYPRAIEGLRKIAADGRELPLQSQARALLGTVERQAAERLTRLRDLAGSGHELAALDALQDFARTFSGTRAAAEGTELRKQLAESPTVKARRREREARDLVLAAREDFRTKRYLACLDRCDLLTRHYEDLPESAEAKELAGAIKDHPERLREACNALAERLAAMQLLLAESMLRQGKPTEAAAALERVIQKCPGTAVAAQAKERLEQVQRLFPRETGDGDEPQR